MEAYRRLEDLVVYQKLFRLHIPESNRHRPQSSAGEDSENYSATSLLDFLNLET
jgi:hypothetical protein